MPPFMVTGDNRHLALLTLKPLELRIWRAYLISCVQGLSACPRLPCPSPGPGHSTQPRPKQTRPSILGDPSQIPWKVGCFTRVPKTESHPHPLPRVPTVSTHLSIPESSHRTSRVGGTAGPSCFIRDTAEAEAGSRAAAFITTDKLTAVRDEGGEWGLGQVL